MSAAISPSTQRPYGVQRVCCIWGCAALDLLLDEDLGRSVAGGTAMTACS
jgi:hypothetical protein